MNKIMAGHKLLLCVVVVMVFMVFFMPIIDYDEYYRLSVASSVGLSLRYVDRLIWLPVYQLILSLFHDLKLLRLLSVLCVGLTSFLVKRFSYMFNREKVAVATSIFYVLNPLVLLYGSTALSESLASLLIVFFAYLFCVEKHYVASLVLGLAVLTSYTAWVFIPFVLFYALRRREKSMFAYLFPIVMLVWWGIINFRFAGNPTHFLDLAQTYYQVLSQKHPMFTNTTFSLFLFPLVYPLCFTFPFYAYLFYKPKRNVASFLSTYFVISCIILLIVGQVLGYVFGWARYFVPLIPFILSTGSKGVYESKHKRLMITAYFMLSLTFTVIQAQYINDFKNEMLGK